MPNCRVGGTAQVSAGSTVLADYVYSATGQRAVKDIAGTATHYLHGPGGVLLAEADGATGGALREYIALGGATLAIVDASGVSYVHADRLTAPQILTDGATGAVVWDATYRPFGQVSSSGLSSNEQRFPGQYADAETGYYDNWHRTYDPALGRYLQSDPIGIEGGWNTYAYAGGNPVMFTDPRGLNAVDCMIDPVFCHGRNPRYGPETGGGGGFGGGGGGGRKVPAPKVQTPTPKGNPGLAGRGFKPPPGTRVIPKGIPNTWRIKPSKGLGGVRYCDPANAGNSVRVMPGNPNSPYPNSQQPYVRWLKNGQSLNIQGMSVPKNTPDAHIPLGDFVFNPGVYR